MSLPQHRPPRAYLGERSSYDPGALTRDAIFQHLQGLREGCRTLKAAPGDHETLYSMWETLERLGKWSEAASALKAELLRNGYGARPALTKLALEEIALVAIDCSTPDLAAEAMQMSMARCNFGQAVLFTDRAMTVPGVRVAPVPRIESEEGYSEFVLKTLVHAVDAEYVLIMQWDGFVIDAARWSDQFLLYDYVGARWPQHRDGYTVGNGGFSLRSRKLLQALQDPVLRALHPEDAAICRSYRDYLERRYGISFAPEEIADAFSFELDVSNTSTFGFHGMFHLPRVIDQPSVKSLAFLEPLVARWQDELGAAA